MLGDHKANVTVTARDLTVAAAFYEGTLGLEEASRENDELISYRCGTTVINVYRSSYAGFNRGTAVTWSVDDIEQVVYALRLKGVIFEHYDMPGLRREGDLHIGNNMKMAWFKDPDGNILNIYSQ
jgi:catechol 2,3-dioxygenase-like lactoylglutathione lyase family enzyme